MTYEQVIEFFCDKGDTPCEITDFLIQNGFQQKKDTGYLHIAKVSEIDNPSQWWHIMSYCLLKIKKHKENDNYRFTPCGELLFWMAEVSEAVTKCELKKLAKEIINNKDISRDKANKKIKALCWKKIKDKVGGEGINLNTLFVDAKEEI